MRKRKLISVLTVAAMSAAMLAGCGSGKEKETTAPTETVADTTETASSGDTAPAAAASKEDVLKKAAADGKVGNWGLGNEYEILALL